MELIWSSNNLIRTDLNAKKTSLSCLIVFVDGNRRTPSVPTKLLRFLNIYEV